MNASLIGSRVEVTVLRDIVQDKVKEAIWNGKLKPGDRIVESQLARELGVSQAPVREALRELEQKGFVVAYPRRGTFVTKPSSQDIRELYSLRIALEQFAARLVVPKLSDDQVNELQQLVDDMRQVNGPDTVAELVRYDQLFHETFVSLSNHTLLAKTWANLQPVQWTFITIAKSLEYDPELFARSHQVLVDVLRTRQLDAVERQFELHIMRSQKDVLAQIDLT